MKNTLLITTFLCALLVFSASPSFAQFQGNTGNSNSSNSQSSTGAMQFTAPNYWGDSRVKNRSTATSNSQGSGSPPMSGGRSGGGGGISPFMLMAPAMMLPAMMRSGLGRVHPNHRPRGYEDDEQKSSKKKKNKKMAQQPSVNDENNMPDPLFPQQNLSTVAKKTLDLQNGSAMPQQPQVEDPRLKVSGVMTDEEAMQPLNQAASQAQPEAPGQVPMQAQLEPVQVPGTDF